MRMLLWRKIGLKISVKPKVLEEYFGQNLFFVNSTNSVCSLLHCYIRTEWTFFLSCSWIFLYLEALKWIWWRQFKWHKVGGFPVPEQATADLESTHTVYCDVSIASLFRSQKVRKYIRYYILREANSVIFSCSRHLFAHET